MKNIQFFFKKNQNIIKLVGINLLLIALLSEVTCLLFYFWQKRQFFYTRDKSIDQLEQQSILPNLKKIGATDKVAATERLHPYFGYVHPPGPDFRIGFKYNNLGFISAYDYPFIRTNKNQFIVGIFGGSVASNYSIYEIQNKILEKKLKELPGFKDRELIVLSFSIGGFKAPQQILLLNYFLSIGQELDLAINIDGFNEVAISSANNDAKYQIYLPSMQQVQPLADLAGFNFSVPALQAMLTVKETEAKLIESLEKLNNCHLASCHFFMSLQVQNLVKTYRDGIKKFERERKRTKRKDIKNSLFYFYQNNQALSDAELYDKAGDNWVKTSIFMDQLLKANKIPYFHFFQPNQYYKTRRIFTADEQKIAFDKDGFYGEAVKKGYPIFLTKIEQIRKNKINFFNALEIFDDTAASVYIDSCCHYNPTGEKILSDYVAQSIFDVLSQSQSDDAKSDSQEVNN